MTLDDALNEGERQPANSRRIGNAVVQPPPGYVVAGAWIVYAAEDLVKNPPEGFHVPDYRAALKRLAESKFKGQIVVTDDETRTRPKGGAPREHIAWSLFVDTPATAAARPQNAKRNGKAPTEKDVPKLLKEVGALVLDNELIAEAQEQGVAPKALARQRVAEKHGITAETLVALTQAFLAA